MCKNRLTLTIFGRFLEGSLTLTTFGRPNSSLTIFGRPSISLGRPNMVKLKFPSKNRPNMVKLSSISVLVLASLFWADGTTSFLYWVTLGKLCKCHSSSIKSEMWTSGHRKRDGLEFVVVVLHNLVPAGQLGAARGGRPRRGHPLPRHPHLQPRPPRPQAEGQAAEIGRGQSQPGFPMSDHEHAKANKFKIVVEYQKYGCLSWKSWLEGKVAWNLN